MAHKALEAQYSDQPLPNQNADLYPDAYGQHPPAGSNDREALLQKLEKLQQKVLDENTPERKRAMEEADRKVLDLVKTLPSEQAQQVMQIISQRMSATNSAERDQYDEKIVAAITDPEKKTAMKQALDNDNKAVGPEMLDDLCKASLLQKQLNLLPDSAQQGYRPNQDAQDYSQSYATLQSGSDPRISLAEREREFDSHVDKLLRSGDGKTIMAAGHAVLEGDLSALKQVFKGNDAKIASIVADVNHGLEQVHSPMQLSTMPGHVFLLPRGGLKAIDIDTKKHTAVERTVKVSPQGEASIDMASVVLGTDLNNEIKSFANDQTRNSWSATGDAKPYYSNGATQGLSPYNPYYGVPGNDPGAQTDSSQGKWHASYGSAAPSNHFGGNDSQSLSQLPDAENDLTQQLITAHRLQLESKDAKETLKQQDPTLQALMKNADENYQKKFAHLTESEHQLLDTFPEEKRQELLHEMDQASLLMSRTSPEEQLSAIFALAGPDGPDKDKFLLDHPVLADALKNSMQFAKQIQPTLEEQAQVQQAADQKLEAGMLYLHALVKAGDPRAKDAFEQMLNGFPKSVREQYLKNSDLRALGKSAGVSLPDDPPVRDNMTTKI